MENRLFSLLFLSFVAKFANTTDSPSNGTVRLVDGDVVSEGRVEIYINGTWGTVCNDGWDLQDGKVVCVQLGMNFTNASELGFFGAGTGPIHFFGVDCSGDETSLVQCPTFRRNDCQHTDDAGVHCYPPATVADDSGLSSTWLAVIILVPFLLLIILITAAICAMLYLTLNYDRTRYEAEENERRIRRFAKGLSLKEQSMLATKGRRGIFRSARRRSDLPTMSGSSSFVDRHNIPRAALGEGLAYSWETNDEAETEIDDDFESKSGRSSHRLGTRSRTGVEAFNPAMMPAEDDIPTAENNAYAVGRSIEQSSIPPRYRRRKQESDDEDSDYNPYEDEPNII